jgi:hypothetical protein
LNDAGALEVDVDVEVDDVAVVVAVVDDKVVGAAWATGRASGEPVVTVVPTTNPTAATTPLTPSHGNK